jgi:hypothetical protein
MRLHYHSSGYLFQKYLLSPTFYFMQTFVFIFCWQSYLPADLGSPTTVIVGRAAYRLMLCITQCLRCKIKGSGMVSGRG